MKTYPGVRLKDWFKGYAALQKGGFKDVRDSLRNEALFHLPHGPFERVDVQAAHPERFAEMREALDDWERRLEAQGVESPAVDASPETLNKLRDLGYIQ
jgi:hypothetical protein